jgi:hypothetical protein
LRVAIQSPGTDDAAARKTENHQNVYSLKAPCRDWVTMMIEKIEQFAVVLLGHVVSPNHYNLTSFRRVQSHSPNRDEVWQSRSS